MLPGDISPLHHSLPPPGLPRRDQGSRSLILGAVSVMRMAGLSVNVILRLALASVLLQMVEARQCRASSDCPAHSPHRSDWGWCQWTDQYGDQGQRARL